MKKINFYLVFALLGIFTFIGCTDDDVESSVPSSFSLNSPVNLTSDQSGASIDIDDTNSGSTVLVLDWERPNATENTVVFHDVQMALAGTNFSNPINLTRVVSNGASISGDIINTALASLGVLPGASTPVEIRVNSTVNDVDFLSSNSVTLNASAFNPNTPAGSFLYIAENYPDWNFLTADILTSPNDDGIFGNPFYVFPEATTFNLVDPSTGSVWGAGSAFDGEFIVGGDPISIANAGMYDFQVNPGGGFFTALQQVWGVIGSATPMSWDNETPMNLDLSNGVWTIDVNLIPGEMKFRANMDWAFNLGDNGFDSSLEFGGANIPVTADGLTTVTLDLSDPSNPTYQIGESEPAEPVESGNTLYLSTDGMTTDGMETLHSSDGDGNFAGFAYLTSGSTYSLIDPEIDMGSVLDTFTVDADGLYRVTVDLMNDTLDAYKLDSWGVIGPASPTAGWDSDSDMNFDPINKTITGTVMLGTGEYKFRANDDWAVNLGDNGADGILEQDGANLESVEAGSYNITIDLNDDTAYTLTIE